MINVLLSSVAEIRGRVGWKGYTVDDLVDYGPLVIGANDITADNRIDLSNAKHLTRVKYEESPEIFIKKNDILVVKVGSTIGKVGIIRSEIGEASINPNCVIVRATKINPYYLYYYLCGPAGKTYLLNNSSASGQPALNQKDLGNLEIPMIGEDRQKQIVDLLNSLTDKIDLNLNISKRLEFYAKFIFDYWFLQFEFPNDEGKPYKSSGGKMVWNEELKREIPLGWECVTLAELFSFTKGKIPAKLYDENDGTLSPYLTIDVVNNGTPQYCNQTSMPFCDKKTIMVMDGAASGDVYTGYTGVLGSTFAMLNPKRKDVSNELLYWILKTLGVIYKKNNTGSTVPHANKSYIGELKIALPKSCEKLSNIFVLNQDKINFLNEENRELINLRKFLLPLLINGQVTFKGSKI